MLSSTVLAEHRIGQRTRVAANGGTKSSPEGPIEPVYVEELAELIF
jgi:hypothetical protein